MSAGDGYKYLLRTVAAADGDRPLSTPLTRYYAGTGTPPGRWLGSGLASLGHGKVTEGAPVSEAQLQLLLGMGLDPVSVRARSSRDESPPEYARSRCCRVFGLVIGHIRRHATLATET